MSIISLYEKSENLFFVGGIVRDELSGRKSPDIDLTFVGNAVDFAKNLDFEILQINEEFGSVHLRINDMTIDITSTRIETYPEKGHLPKIEKIGCTLKEDVFRRDFTVNAIAKNCKSGEIIDYTGGIEDLKDKKLRVLHEKSFIDDPTRIIRGLKFAVRFDFELEANTKKLQDEYLQNVNYNMSFKRLKDELIDAFNINKQKVLDKFINEKMYKLLSDKEFIPYMQNTEEFIKPYLKEIKYMWLVYLGGFDLTNIPLNKKESKIIEDYQKLSQTNLCDDFETYKMFGLSEIESILIYGLTINPQKVKKYLDELRKIKLSISGKDLVAIGFEPSEKISKTLNAVLQIKLEHPELTLDEELDIARTYL